MKKMQALMIPGIQLNSNTYIQQLSLHEQSFFNPTDPTEVFTLALIH